MTETLRQSLPQIYRDLLPPFFDAEAPRETKATCDSCAMCPPADRPPSPGVVYFRPDAKCCTFQPRLPNYLVGSILRDSAPDMAEGKRRIGAQIEGRIGVTPQWLAPSRKYSLLLEASRESSFGRSTALRCRYYEEAGGLCTVWRHREANCSTFFCKYVAGADGQTFWRDVDRYLRRVEARLSRYAVTTLDPGLEEPPLKSRQLTLEELEDRSPDAAAYGSIWGTWEGREEELYLACHDLIAGLSRDDFDRIVEARPPELLALEESRQRLQVPTLPERVTLNPEGSPKPLSEGVLITTYSRYEPIQLTPALHEVLQEFGPGETVAEVRARLLRDQEIDIPESMLIELYQLRVIVAA